MTLTVKTKKTKDHKFKLDITIPYERLQVHYESVRRSFGKGVKMPGFRKGKVPTHIIEKHYKESLQARTIEEAISKAYGEVVKQERLETYGQPVAEKVSKYRDNEPLQVSIVVDKKPSCIIHYDKKIKLFKDEVFVAEEDILREATKTLRQNKATITTHNLVEHKEDIVHFNLEFEAEAFKKYSSKGQKMPMDDDLFKDSSGLREHFWKMNAGDQKSLQHTWPTEGIDAGLAGKTTAIRLEVTTIEHINIPNLTDEVARELGHDSKEAMLSEIRASLMAWAEENIQSQLRRQVLELMKQRTTYEIAESVLQSMADYHTNHFLERAYGADRALAEATLKKSGSSVEKVRSDYERMTESSLKTELFMERLIAEKGIDVSEKTMEEKVQSIASSRNEPYEECRKNMIRNGDFNRLRRALQEQQALDFLLNEVISIKKGKRVRLSDLTPNQTQ